MKCTTCKLILENCKCIRDGRNEAILLAIYDILEDIKNRMPDN